MPTDPRIEAVARADLPLWTGSRFDDLAGDRHREWRLKQAAVVLAAADAVDPLRQAGRAIQDRGTAASTDGRRKIEVETLFSLMPDNPTDPATNTPKETA